MALTQYKPEVFGPNGSSETAGEHQIARQYLEMRDDRLAPHKLAEYGEQLLESNKPEYRYYGAWSCLEAAYPGLFSMEDPGTWIGDVQTAPLTEKAFKAFSALSRRTPYYTDQSDQRTLDVEGFVFGQRAQLMTSIEPSFVPARRLKGALVAKAVTERYEEAGKLFRRQDIALTKLRTQTARGSDKAASYEELQGRVRGLEVENTLLGLGWRNLCEGGDIVLLPASPRLDYTLQGGKDRMPVDVIAIHRNTEQHLGIPLRRDVVISRRNGENTSYRDDVVRLYGDRDLFLAPMKAGNIASYSPTDFTSFDKEHAYRIMRIISNRFDSLQAASEQ